MLASYALVPAVPFARNFFELAGPNASILLPTIARSALAIVWPAVLDDRFVPGRGAATAAPSRSAGAPPA